jgi:serine/threonine-protein kinase
MAEAAKYRILQELGAGGMGTVCKGLLVGQAGFQRPIVMKQLRNREPEHLRLFVEEARRYAVLDHENIGRIFDFEEVRGEPCIILEYIDGWTLVEYLDRQRQLRRAHDPELCIFIASRVCRALQYVFEKAAIVHRDISPSNIMITREGSVKLIDFGIATRSGTRDSHLTGKPSYMAPEMVIELRADHRSDIFSLGTVLFEILTGQRLFRGKTTADILEQVVAGQIPSVRVRKPGLPDPVVAIVERALQRDPAQRFPSAGSMGEACEHFLYDKGYGPTNLTLKHHLAYLFPDREAAEREDEERFPVVEATLIPVGQGAPQATGRRTDGATRVSPLGRAYARVVTQQPAESLLAPNTQATGSTRPVQGGPASPPPRTGTIPGKAVPSPLPPSKAPAPRSARKMPARSKRARPRRP